MEIPAAVFGLVTAFGLGTGDFIARFTSRAIGPFEAAAGMLLFGAVFSAVATLAMGEGFPTLPGDIALGIASGVISALGMMSFYLALTLGQLGFVIPLAATYSVWSVLYDMAFGGLVVTPLLGLAMAATLAGAWIVARYGQMEDGPEAAGIGPHAAEPPMSGFKERLFVAGLAVFAGLAMVIGVYLANPAAETSSEIGVLAYARGSAAATIFGYILFERLTGRAEHKPLGRWPLAVALQGFLDGLGVLALYLATATAEGALGFVVSSSFGVVTVLLGWTILRERITGRQWLGIFLAMGGAMSLTALS